MNKQRNKEALVRVSSKRAEKFATNIKAVVFLIIALVAMGMLAGCSGIFSEEMGTMENLSEDGYYRVDHVVPRYDMNTGEEVYWIVAGKMSPFKMGAYDDGTGLWGIMEPNEGDYRLYKIKRTDLRIQDSDQQFIVYINEDTFEVVNEPLAFVRQLSS